MTVKRAYAEKTAHDNLSHDPAQTRIVAALDHLQHRHIAAERNTGHLRKWFQSLAGSGVQERTGIYIWGGVGRGKTFLMDLFFETLAIDGKRRIHFHRMMSEIHARLRALGDIEDPLEKVADAIAKDTVLLCFDEFFVSDIADAMILGKLLDVLFRRGVTLVATSNSPPSRLYPDGLQRDRFLPAIALLERHTQVMEMDGGTDYRLRLLQKADTYLSPCNEAARNTLERFFSDLAPGKVIERHRLDILGREIQTVRCAKGVAWFEFSELCDGPRSQQDYIELARWYQTVILSDVPMLGAEKENAARRFIALVDEFYDRKVKLLISAAAPAASLYQGRQLQFEFRRTRSRLTEMQTAEYLHKAHLA